MFKDILFQTLQNNNHQVICYSIAAFDKYILCEILFQKGQFENMI